MKPVCVKRNELQQNVLRLKQLHAGLQFLALGGHTLSPRRMSLMSGVLALTSLFQVLAGQAASTMPLTSQLAVELLFTPLQVEQ
jgi:hypothetical protein